MGAGLVAGSNIAGWESQPIPQPIHEFVLAFDRGNYPDLIEASADQWVKENKTQDTSMAIKEFVKEFQQ